LHRDVSHSTQQSSLAINISDTIPVEPAALPFFIILGAFEISSVLISSQVSLPFTNDQVKKEWRKYTEKLPNEENTWDYPMCSPHSAVFLYTFSIPSSLDHFLLTLFHLHIFMQFTPTTSCLDIPICFATLWTFFFPTVLSNSLTSLVFSCARATMLVVRLANPVFKVTGLLKLNISKMR